VTLRVRRALRFVEEPVVAKVRVSPNHTLDLDDAAPAQVEVPRLSATLAMIMISREQALRVRYDLVDGHAEASRIVRAYIVAVRARPALRNASTMPDLRTSSANPLGRMNCGTNELDLGVIAFVLRVVVRVFA
jgi:hypothetical protein